MTKDHSLCTLHEDRATLYIHRNHKRLGPLFFSILPQRESNSNNDRFNIISNLASYMHEHLDALAKLEESDSSFHLRNSHNPSSIFVIDLVITK